MMDEHSRSALSSVPRALGREGESLFLIRIHPIADRIIHLMMRYYSVSLR